MAAFSRTRRFIAGARCSACGQEDRIVVYHRDGIDYRECVACGVREARSASDIVSGEGEVRRGVTVLDPHAKAPGGG